MCASDEFHRSFSSFDYDARRDFCVFEYRGKIRAELLQQLHRVMDALVQCARSLFVVS
jgi:hypothetical protein